MTFAFFYEFNPLVAEKTDGITEAKAEKLLEQPMLSVQRERIPGRLLIVPEVSLIISYWADGPTIRIMRVLHEKRVVNLARQQIGIFLANK